MRGREFRDADELRKTRTDNENTSSFALKPCMYDSHTHRCSYRHSNDIVFLFMDIVYWRSPIDDEFNDFLYFRIDDVSVFVVAHFSVGLYLDRPNVTGGVNNHIFSREYTRVVESKTNFSENKRSYYLHAKTSVSFLCFKHTCRCAVAESLVR